MTKEEIKSMYSMRDIAERCGYKPNRAGFIHCPFHKGDREPSMKLYKDSYHCFGCGASGDIFSFIQEVDHCDFRTAFMSLGGTYEKPTFSSKFAIYSQHKKVKQRHKKEDRIQDQINENDFWLNLYRKFLFRATPLSDAWCDCYIKVQYHLYINEELEKKREEVEGF